MNLEELLRGLGNVQVPVKVLVGYAPHLTFTVDGKDVTFVVQGDRAELADFARKDDK